MICDELQLFEKLEEQTMAQLILVSVREDGDYDTIAAVQNDDNVLEIPALEWVLQMKEHFEDVNKSVKFAILHRDELVGVIDGEAEDITALCEEAFNGGQPCL